ncbi:hypothetical protein RUM44_000230 [Polyplax serrata]|uniref:Uncharacterized protein n=1 Tax=Polyplax serrata TaxID=468196 RepID=A0ABR1B4W9_POLSC
MEVCSEPAKEKIEFRDIMRKIWESNTFCSPCDVILLDNDGLGDVGQVEKEEWKRVESFASTQLLNTTPAGHLQATCHMSFPVELTRCRVTCKIL